MKTPVLNAATAPDNEPYLADWIVEGRAPELVRAIAADPRLLKTYVKLPSAPSCSVVQALAMHQRIDVLRAALRLGLNINSMSCEHEFLPTTLLIYAILTSKPRVVRFAIDQGADLAQRCARGRTPLAESLIAVTTMPAEVDVEILDMLLAAKAPWADNAEPEGSPFNQIIRATWLGRADEMAEFMHKIARAGFPLDVPAPDGKGSSPSSPVEIAIHSGNRRALNVVAQIARTRLDSAEGQGLIERLHMSERETWVPEITGVMMTITDDPDHPHALEALGRTKPKP